VIPFTIFANALYDYLGTYGVIKPENPESDVYYLCLKVMVVDPKEVNPSVTLERLLLVEKWFGPLIDENYYKKSPRKNVRVNSSTTTATTILKKDPSNPSINKVAELQQTSPRKSKTKKDDKKADTDRKSKKNIEQTTPRNSHTGVEKSPRKPSTEETKNLNMNLKVRPEKIAPSIEQTGPTECGDTGPSKLTPNERQKTRSRLSRLSKEIPPDERPEERTLLGTLKRILEQTWFHGDISKENADSSLATNKIQETSGIKLFGTQAGPQGDFLIRLSFSEPVEKHPFTITKVDKKGVIFHQRIFYDEEAHLYKVFTKNPATPEIVADSLISLVKALTDSAMVHKPCKRWNYARKYDDIFQQKELHDKGYLDQGYLDN